MLTWGTGKSHRRGRLLTDRSLAHGAHCANGALGRAESSRRNSFSRVDRAKIGSDRPHHGKWRMNCSVFAFSCLTYPS